MWACWWVCYFCCSFRLLDMVCIRHRKRMLSFKFNFSSHHNVCPLVTDTSWRAKNWSFTWRRYKGRRARELGLPRVLLFEFSFHISYLFSPYFTSFWICNLWWEIKLQARPVIWIFSRIFGVVHLTLRLLCVELNGDGLLAWILLLTG